MRLYYSVTTSYAPNYPRVFDTKAECYAWIRRNRAPNTTFYVFYGADEYDVVTC